MRGRPWTGCGLLKDLSEREIRRATDSADEAVLSEIALLILYRRKAFRDATGMNEEHYPHGDPKPHGHGPSTRHGPDPKKKKRTRRISRARSPLGLAAFETDVHADPP